MATYFAEDIGAQLSKRVYNPEFSMKDVKEYLTEVMPMWLGHLEKLAPPLTKQVSHHRINILESHQVAKWIRVKCWVLPPLKYVLFESSK